MNNSRTRTGTTQTSTANPPSTSHQIPAGTTPENVRTALDEPEGADAPSDGEEEFEGEVAGLQILGTSSGKQQRLASDGGDTTIQAPGSLGKDYEKFDSKKAESVGDLDEPYTPGTNSPPSDPSTSSSAPTSAESRLPESSERQESKTPVFLSAQQQDQLADILEHITRLQDTPKEIPIYLSDPNRQTVIETAAQSGVRSALPRILEGTLVVAGVSTVTLLAIGGLAPLLIPAATGTLTTTIAVGWLTNIGSNALASWIQGWAQTHAGKIFSSNLSERTQELAQQMAPALEADMRGKPSLAKALTHMLEKLDIRRMMSDTIARGLKIHSAVLARLEDERRAQQQENAELRSITSYLIEQLTHARAQSTQASNTVSSPSTAPHADAHPSTGPPMTEQERLDSETLLKKLLNE